VGAWHALEQKLLEMDTAKDIMNMPRLHDDGRKPALKMSAAVSPLSVVPRRLS
jgi:hypothetical protein